MRACDRRRAVALARDGPLVVLEAFDAGTPVLGARLGGIAELVTDGTMGSSRRPEAGGLGRCDRRACAGRPAEIARLRAGIRPPRTIDAVAGELAAIRNEPSR